LRSVTGSTASGLPSFGNGQLPMTMADWAKHLDRILIADDMEILKDAGKITAEIAKEHAENEFEKYRVIQDRLFKSDFDKQMELFNEEDK